MPRGAPTTSSAGSSRPRWRCSARSPSALLSSLNANNAGTSTIETSFTEQESPSTWRLGHRLEEPFEPYEALCVFHVATCTMIPRMFGCTNVRAEEVTCLRRGDAWCTMRLSWDENGGRTLGLEVVAEGIGELAQATALRDRHCHLGQGFLYSRPVPADVFAAFFAPAVPV